MIGYWYGLRAGLMTGFAYGLLQLISDPYIISLPQMITDYLLAFGALGLSGLIFFAEYAEGTGMSAPVYSLAYNGSYLGIEAALTIILLAIPAVRNGFEKVKQMAQEK